MVNLDASHPADAAFRSAVGASLSTFLEGRRAALHAISPRLDAVSDRAQAFTAGGKRLRPAFCAWGWVACGGSGSPLPDAVLAAAASLDLLHVSALMHDDVMDASDTRRGVPAAHRQFEADHRAAGALGDPEAFGRAGAILLGDLLLAWSAEMFGSSAELFGAAGLDPDAAARARPYLDAVRSEVQAGQYLDIVAQSLDPLAASRTPAGLAELESIVARVVTYKSACYTVERPLNIGGALAGASAAQQATFTAYGRPLGRAFQYRDDLLGVFGDESLTGKESGEDLREGKLTLLIIHTYAHASAAGAKRLAGLLGRPDLSVGEVDDARQIIAESGAQSFVEDAIEREYAAALGALAGAQLSEDGILALGAMADAAVKRAF